MLSPNLPKPILLHPLKHHLGYLREFVRHGGIIPTPTLQAALQSIGNASQLDLYTGSLSARHISEEVILYLQERGVLAPEAFRQYLTAHGAAYRIVTLSDTTAWVLRWGVVAGRHVHLHPARFAAHTIRVKANVLKTAVAVAIATQTHAAAADLQLVNQVRTEWLALPPVKTFAPGAGVANVLTLLQTSC